MVELLVVMVVIAMLTAATIAALEQARNTARAARTKAMIVKLNDLVMRKYESYLTRRVPINTTGMTPKVAAQARLDAIRDLMRMEMPDRWTDIIDEPAKFSWGSIQRPSVSRLYKQKYDARTPDTTADPSNGKPGYGPAECLYLTVMTGNAEAREFFTQDEIGDTDGDGWPEFLDGWGFPIMWLRWAPGFSEFSAIQVANPETHHDPFDPRKMDKAAYHLLPLIYSSSGSRTDYGLRTDGDYRFAEKKSPYASVAGQMETGRLPISNHYMTQD